MVSKDDLLYGIQFVVTGLSVLYFWSFMEVFFPGNYFMQQTPTTLVIGFFVFLIFAAGIDVYRKDRLKKNEQS